MLRVSMSSTNNQSLAINFLNFAVRNYISARILYLNNQLHDAGVMSHEAFEKVMKALIYFKDNNYVLNDIHDLNRLRTILFNTFGYNTLKDNKEIFKYYEDCYSYRYPNQKQPRSFSTNTNMFNSLDNIFFFFHEECLKEIVDDDSKYSSGIFTEATSYFKSNDQRDLYKIIDSNKYINQDYINIGKEHWHKKGIYLKNSKGVTLYPNGSVTVEH